MKPDQRSPRRPNRRESRGVEQARVLFNEQARQELDSDPRVESRDPAPALEVALRLLMEDLWMLEKLLAP